jgi:hypothetical protein
MALGQPVLNFAARRSGTGYERRAEMLEPEALAGASGSETMKT